MELKERAEVLDLLGKELRRVIKENDETYNSVCQMSYQKNNWFTKTSIEQSMLAWADVLDSNQVTKWIERYKISNAGTQKKISVINAGNIPLVGLHDMLSVFISGHLYLGKNSSDDHILLPFVVSLLNKINKK